MKKFNKLVKSNITFVMINLEWYRVKSIHESRQWIEVYGLLGSFQWGHVTRFTNKAVI